MHPTLAPVRARAVTALLAIALAACGGGGGEPTGVVPVVPVAVTVTPTSASVAAGATRQLAASVTGTSNGAVTWGSSASGVATVSGTGLVTGIAAGTAQVTATSVADPLKSASATITVTAAAPAPGFAIAVTPTSASLSQGSTTSLTVTLTRTNGFADAVALTVSGLPSGVTATFAPASLSGTATTSTLTLTATGTATVGSATLTVRANATGQAERTATAALTVSSAGGGASGITIVLNTPTITIGRGQHAWIAPILTGSGGNGTVSVSGTPAGVTAGFALSDFNTSPNPTGSYSLPGQGNLAIFKLVVAPSAALGTTTITVRADPSDQALADVTTTLQVTIVDPQAATSPAWRTLSAGSGAACGIRADDRLYCWGINSGDRTASDRWVPTITAGQHLFSQVSVGAGFSCGVTTAQLAWCWGGTNSLGQLGVGDASVIAREPMRVTGGLSFASVSAANSHACGLTPQGKAYCWGAQFEGVLGDGVVATTNADFRAAPTAVLGTQTFASIAVGPTHSCALTSAGQAWCWGGNGSGQLGDGTTTTRSSPVAVQGTVAFKRIASMGTVTCALALDGALYCWGSSAWIPGAANTNYLTPTRIGTGTYTHIDGNTTLRCAVATGGQAYCWGSNTYGELGNGTTTNSSKVMVPVSGGLQFSTLEVGRLSACGVASTGAVYCWGYNNNGELGDGTTTSRTVPTIVKTF